MANKGETGILTLYSDVEATSVRWLYFISLVPALQVYPQTE